MQIKIWDGKTDRLEKTVEISNEEIDHFIRMFGESFGDAFGRAIVKGLEVEK